jgi:hypothetical protein
MTAPIVMMIRLSRRVTGSAWGMDAKGISQGV